MPEQLQNEFGHEIQALIAQSGSHERQFLPGIKIYRRRQCNF